MWLSCRSSAGAAGGKLPDIKLDELEAAPLKTQDAPVAEIFQDVSGDKLLAARKTLTWLKDHPQPKELIDTARVLTFMKGTDAHDYKFSAAVLEDFARLSPGWRDRHLASSMFWMKGAGAEG